MQKELRKLSELHGWKKNPRTIGKKDFALLKKKIQRWGQFKPVLITPDGEVIGGNMRLKAYAELGINEVWVSIIEPKSEAEKTEMAIADNESAGSWDQEALKSLAMEFQDEINLDDYKIDLDAKAWSTFLPASLIPEDETPQVDMEQVHSKPGEIYQLGRHRLMCGDSTDPANIALLMDGKLADMVFTDPPYNVDYEGKTKDKLKIKNDKFENNEFYQFLYNAFTGLSQATKEGGAAYACHADSEGLNFRKAFIDSGFLLKQCLIWNKNAFLMGRLDYQWKHEPILYGWKEGSSHTFYGGRAETTVWDIDRPQRSEDHPTMKPVALCARAIQNSSKGDDIVLDTFAGSGSTLMAAEQTGRICYTMELDPHYVDVIRKRYAAFINQEEKWLEVTDKI